MKRAASGLLAMCAAACSSGTSPPAFAEPPSDDSGADGAPSYAPGDDAALAGDGATPVLVGLEGGAGWGGGSSCQPGTYVGTYNGVNDSSKLGGPPNFPISGPMAITLVRGSQTQNGENFDLVTNDAAFDATWGGFTVGDGASGLIVTHADLAGQLDCANAAFTAHSTDATWKLLGVPAGSATMVFTGRYDPVALTISGQFESDAALTTSKGTWTITLTD
jgi:hypothetical protein